MVLEINDVVESDAGLYKVRAKNKFGEVAASINLNFSREWMLFTHPVRIFMFHTNLLTSFSPSLPQPWTRPSCREFHRLIMCSFEPPISISTLSSKFH